MKFMSMLIIFIMFFLPASVLAKREHPEKWYQQMWCKEHDGQVEVVLPDGARCDCVTETHAIQFDFGLPEFCTSWRLSYARHLKARLSRYKRDASPLITQQMEASSSPLG